MLVLWHSTRSYEGDPATSAEAPVIGKESRVQKRKQGSENKKERMKIGNSRSEWRVRCALGCCAAATAP